MATHAATERSLRADARRNRERILRAALAAFAENGPDAQMDDIARRAGLGVGTLYRHFATKDALIGELIGRKLSRFAERARRRLEDERADPFENFAGLLREQAEHMARDVSEQGMMFAATQDAVDRALPVIQDLQAALQELIDRARAAGELRGDVQVDDVRNLMCGLGGIMSAEARGVMSYDWRRQLEFFVDGVRTRPDAPGG